MIYCYVTLYKIENNEAFYSKNVGKAESKAEAIIQYNKRGSIICFIELTEEEYNELMEDIKAGTSGAWHTTN